MRRTGRIVHAVAAAVALVEMSAPGPERPPPLVEDPHYGSCTELVVRLDAGAWFDDHLYDDWGQVLIVHGTEGAYRLTEWDVDCLRGSDALRRLVRADVETYRDNQASECRTLRDVPVQPDSALAAYRDEVCAKPRPSLLLGEEVT